MQLPEVGDTMWTVTESLKNGRNYVVQKCTVKKWIPKPAEAVLLSPHGQLIYWRPGQKHAYFSREEAVQAAHRMAEADNQRIGWMVKTGVIIDEL